MDQLNQPIRRHSIFENKEEMDMGKIFPQYFTIEVCNNCNARCVMCPKSRAIQNKKEVMSDVLFKKFVREIEPYKNHIKGICLNSDGEPTLDKNLVDKISLLKKSGIEAKINFSTNALLLDEKLITDLLASGLDDIRISIDSIKKATFEKIRIGLSFEKVMGNILNLIRLRDQQQSKLEIRVRMVKMDENAAEANEWTTFWHGKLRDSDKVQIMPCHTWSGVVQRELDEQIQFYADKPCVSIFTSFTLNYDGIVQLCDSDIDQKVIMGDFNQDTIQEIWQSDKFARARTMHLNRQRNEIPICRGCDHWSRIFTEI